MSWHADVETLDRYLDDRLGTAHAASVEAHLLACPTCRDTLGRRSQTVAWALERHRNTWDRIAQGVDRPQFMALERLLGRVGARYSVVRLAAGAPALRQAWWLAGFALLALAVVAAHLGSGTIGTVMFVVTAPVVPLIGVALSYGAHGEPAGEVATVAPYSVFRLVVVRTLVVLLSSVPVAALFALALPTHPTAGLLWFVPALALCSLSLAASTFVDPLLAAGILAACWLAAAGLAIRGPRWMPAGQMLDQFVAFRSSGQLLLAVLALAGLLVAVVRRSAFDTWSAP